MERRRIPPEPEDNLGLENLGVGRMLKRVETSMKILKNSSTINAVPFTKKLVKSEIRKRRQEGRRRKGRRREREEIIPV